MGLVIDPALLERSPEDSASPLGAHVLRGAAWSSASKFGALAVQLAGGVALARILSPDDFGLFAGIYVVAGFGSLMVELGLSSAIVHRRDLREEDLATAFWLNLLIGVAVTLVLGLSGPLLAALFNAPRMATLVWWVALPNALALSVVHFGLLERTMRFRLLAIADITATAVGVSISVSAALLGAGYYALAFGPIAQVLVMNLLLWSFARWRPRHWIERESVRRLWSFSGGQVGFNLINYWTRNADNLLVGRYAGASQLGFYSRSYNIMLLPVMQISQSLGRVMFPALTALGDDKERVRTAYLRALRVICALTFPVLLVLAASADNFVVTVWGAHWLPSGDLLAILCLSAVPQCLMTSVGWLYQSQGRTDLMFRTGCVSAVVTVTAFLLGVPWGAAGVATAMLVRCWLIMPWILSVPARLVGLRARDVLLVNAPAAAAALAAGLVAAVAGAELPAWPRAVLLLCQVALGTCTYVFLLWRSSPSLFAELSGLALRRTRVTLEVAAA